MTDPRRTILLVDDNAAERELCRRACAEVAPTVTVHELDDGTAAIDFLTTRASEHVVDLVLLDLSVPGAGGFEVLNAVRRAPARSTLPLIVFSNSGQADDVAEAYRRGANSYVVKPLRFDRLCDVMRTLTHFWFGCASLPPR